MVALNLCDKIEVCLSDKLQITSNDPSICGANGTIYKAVQIFQESFGKEVCVKIKVEKRIPKARGLGGGSSNAASVLLGLNRIFGTPFKKRDLMKMGKNIGADVPFFIFGKAAIATGIGEILHPFLPFSQLPILLVCPPLELKTSTIYEEFDSWLTKKGENISMLKRKRSFLENDFENIVFKMYPELSELKKEICANKACFCSLSGTGSSVYGIFRNREELEKAYFRIHERYIKRNFEIFKLETLDPFSPFQDIGVSPSGKARDFGSRIRRFESSHPSRTKK